MKKVRNFILPVAVLLIGAGAAFATNSSKDAELLLEKGFRYDSVTKKCIATNVDCSHLPNPVCTWSGQPLYRLDVSQPTMCGIQLNQP